VAQSKPKQVKPKKPEKVKLGEFDKPVEVGLFSLAEVTFALHDERIEYTVHYPTENSAVVEMRKGLNAQQLARMSEFGAVLAQDMVVRIICQNDHPDD
jgi:hypothetical protein